jgi:hypothetical protein
MTAPPADGQPSNVESIAAVRAMVADARPVRTTRKPVQKIAAPPGDWVPDRLGLPPDCPVRPLGIQGDRLWFLDGIGQVRTLDPPYGKGHVLGLFCGQMDYLAWAWPRWGKADEKGRPAPVNGYANEDVSAALLRACAAKGPWDSMSKIRGRGCWTDAAGNLVIHTGTAIISGTSVFPPGEHDGHVYPTRAEIAPPFPMREGLPFDPALLLNRTLASWSWGRPGIDPHLLIGWIGAAFLGAALPWRPMVFMTGDKGTGKSTLQSMLKAIFGDWLIQAADTTAAGLYQHVGLDAVPIAVDELESEADVRKQKAVLKLARLASSGAAMLRGGDRHQGVEFNARSAFLFSSINAPPLEPQDLSRMALLRLDKLKPGLVPPTIDPRTFAVAGRAILRRLLEEWPRFHETFNAFAGELQAAGMDGRGQAQFGTLLACADLVSHRGWDDSRLSHPVDVDGVVRPWRELLKPSEMIEFEDGIENWRGCLGHLLSVRVEAWRSGSRSTVGQVLQEYHAETDMTLDGANTLLSQAGLKIVRKAVAPGRTLSWLVIHNQGPLIKELFNGSKWAGELGAGVWTAALRQGPQGSVWEYGNERVNGAKGRATLISLDGLYGPGGVMAED